MIARPAISCRSATIFFRRCSGCGGPGVTVALGTLKSAGLIRNSHARLAILDRAGLEAPLASATAPSGMSTPACFPS
jgi:hypothetical protein